jgi:hypothetical protein
MSEGEGGVMIKVGFIYTITLSLTLPPQEGGNCKVTTVAIPQGVIIHIEPGMSENTVSDLLRPLYCLFTPACLLSVDLITLIGHHLLPLTLFILS